MDRADWTSFHFHDCFVGRPCHCCAARDLGLFAERLARPLDMRSGHKQTFRSAIAMSDLPLKADMCSTTRHVR